MSHTQRRIADALSQLERDGTLGAEQRRVVEQRLAGALDARAGAAGRFTTILVSLGAVLVAAGILYLCAYHWEGLAKGTKLAIVFGGLAALHGAGFALAVKPGGHAKLGIAFTLIGVLSFGAAIGLVAQIYNLRAHYPWAMCAWWILSVPILLVTRSRAILVVVLALFLGWAGWHTGVWLDDLSKHAFERGLIAGFGLLAAGIAVFLAGLARSCAGTRFASFSAPLGWLVRPLAAFGPFLLAFRDPWKTRDPNEHEFLFWTGRGDLAAGHFAPFAIAITAGVVLLAWNALRDRGVRSTLELWILAGTALFLAANVWLQPGSLFLTANAMLLALAVGWSWVGVHTGSSSTVYFAVLVFTATVIARYFEYLWDKLEGAFAFLSIGALLVAAGFLLDNRRRALKARLAREGA
jgi:uncharacterized membrane protein